jgi:hypothetical protein
VTVLRSTSALWTIASLAVAGCAPSESLRPPPLVVELSGCSAVVAGAACEIGGKQTIRLWVKASADAVVTLRAGGAEIVAPRTLVDGGMQIPFEVSPSARTITVTAARGRAVAEVRIALTARERSPTLDRARELRKSGRIDEAARILEGVLADPDAPGRQQATRDLARVERARGAGDRAVVLFREAILRDHEARRVSEEIDDRLALAYTLLYDARADPGRFEEARTVLGAIAPGAREHDDGRARAPYYLGLVAHETGDLRAALPLFRLSAERSARLGLVDERLDALALWADTLVALGRQDEAVAILGELEAAIPPVAAACRRAQLVGNAGWIALRAASEGAARDPRPLLVEAVDLYRHECPSGPKLANALTNLALAELDRGRRPDARRLLDDARAAAPASGARVRVFWKILEGRLDLEDGRLDEARRAYDELATLGDEAAIPEARLEAAIGRAQALDALGATAQARAAYDESARILDDWSLLVALGEGRDTFLARHDRRARLHLDFLLRTATPREAALAARRSRARMLAALQGTDRAGSLSPERRAAWERALHAYRAARAALDEQAASDVWLPLDRRASAFSERTARQSALRSALDLALAELGAGRAATPEHAVEAELPTLSPGELMLVFHPVRGGWAGFALRRDLAVARRLVEVGPGDPPEVLAERLLAPFRDLLHDANRLRIAAYGDLDRVDFHALPWEGRPLIASLPVAYAVDPPEPEAPERLQDPAIPRALLVSDPLDDLPSARREITLAAAALAQRGWNVQRIEGADATHARVRAALEAPDLALFHYAGHALFEGRDGWESGLPLAAGGWITVGDLLTLPRGPGLVILSGCETARTPDAARAEGLGLAQAFVLAGARAVVASARPVRDELAPTLIAALYERALETAPAPRAPPARLDLPIALAGAQVEVRAELPAADWSSFRVLVR